MHLFKFEKWDSPSPTRKIIFYTENGSCNLKFWFSNEKPNKMAAILSTIGKQNRPLPLEFWTCWIFQPPLYLFNPKPTHFYIKNNSISSFVISEWRVSNDDSGILCIFIYLLTYSFGILSLIIYNFSMNSFKDEASCAYFLDIISFKSGIVFFLRRLY